MQAKSKLIEEARLLPHVTVLCLGKKRPNLTERMIEQACFDLLRAEEWEVYPVIAEMTGRARRAPKGSLDAVGLEPYRPWTLSPLHPWLLEFKDGRRDLTTEQLVTIYRVLQCGARVIICDAPELLRDWLNERKGKVR